MIAAQPFQTLPQRAPVRRCFEGFNRLDGMSSLISSDVNEGEQVSCSTYAFITQVLVRECRINIILLTIYLYACVAGIRMMKQVGRLGGFSSKTRRSVPLTAGNAAPLSSKLSIIRFLSHFNTFSPSVSCVYR
jgi:hypothetical protein